MADDLKSGDIPTYDSLSERLDEDIDSTQRVIYTFQAKLGMLVTDNADALEDEGLGIDNPTVEQRMYYAMRADVIEALKEDFSIDFNSPFACSFKDADGDECGDTFDSFEELKDHTARSLNATIRTS